MRTFIALILTLLLCGCAATALVNVQNETAPVAVETAPQETLTPEEQIAYTVDLYTWTDTAAAENGTELATYRFDLPVLTAVREDGTVIVEPQTPAEEQAAAVAAAFNEKFGKWAAAEEFHEVVSWAEEDLAFRREEGIDWPAPYTLELDCMVYQTEHLISVSGTYYSYTGGTHPNTWMLGWNFDLQTGEFFDPGLLAEGTELQEAVTAELIRQARLPDESGYIPAEMYWEDYENIMANWASYAVTFDEAGMNVVFSAYELAPYAEGPQEFCVPYEFLEPHLNDTGRLLLGLAEASGP